MDLADELALAGLMRLAEELYRESAKSATPLAVQLERSADIITEGLARGELHSVRVRMTVYWLSCFDGGRGAGRIADSIVTGAVAVFELLDRPMPMLRSSGRR
ncbi:hypothetical protein [Herbiconiux solani]|uniref:hypothetical protein n=1 Tax=Herbiconiux solani TaxID=661329 RepID=UPI000825D814|nr:hypothetical protein [Herbiconiux solani]